MMAFDSRPRTGHRPFHGFVVAALALCVSACGQGPAVAELSDVRAVSLADTHWQVEDVASGGIIDRAHITMEFLADGTLAGSAGCNRYIGPYRADGNRLTTGQFAVTRKGCVPALMNLEQTFLDVLTHPVKFSVNAQHIITVAAADGRTLRAIRTPDAAQ